MKIQGASIRRFLDKPDKAVRAVLLYGPNESFVHEAAQTLARWAVSKSDDPYAITKLSDGEIKSDSARLVDALSAQSLLGGPTVVWARIDGKGADAAIVDALDGFERDEPLGYLIVEAGDLGSTAELVKKFGAASHAGVIAFYEETDAERAVYGKALAKELGITFDRDAEDYFLTTLPNDRGLARQEIEKLALYAHHGVPEVWIVDLRGCTVDVCRQPGPAGYAEQRLVVTGEVTPALVPTLRIDVSALIGA